MPAAKPITHGMRFGRWSVLTEVEPHREPSGSSVRRVLCQCECGTTKEVAFGVLRSGESQSCGCLRLENLRRKTVKHGCSRRVNGKHRKTRAYVAWTDARQRCGNPKHRVFKHYGGRGISVCERWHVFQNFLEDMGEPPPSKSLDRLNNDGNYEPANCAWRTQKEQTNNRRPRHRLVSHL